MDGAEGDDVRSSCRAVRGARRDTGAVLWRARDVRRADVPEGSFSSFYGFAIATPRGCAG